MGVWTGGANVGFEIKKIKTISSFIGMTIDVVSFPLSCLQNWHFPSELFFLHLLQVTNKPICYFIKVRLPYTIGGVDPLWWEQGTTRGRGQMMDGDGVDLTKSCWPHSNID